MPSPQEKVDVVLDRRRHHERHPRCAMLTELQPDWNIRVYERLNYVAKESSDPWNNAGTGHSALCELNYSPEKANGDIDITKAVNIAEQFQVSRQFWSYLVDEGVITDPKSFINSVPHISYGRGEKGRDYIKRRYDTMVSNPLFKTMEYSDDAATQARVAAFDVREAAAPARSMPFRRSLRAPTWTSVRSRASC
jgi:malate dehydrogenase (quinone)